jgi:hypothetical protein
MKRVIVELQSAPQHLIRHAPPTRTIPHVSFRMLFCDREAAGLSWIVIPAVDS